MQPEAWLRGPLPGVDPLIAPVLCSFQQAREDLAKHTQGLTTEHLWARPYGLAPVGFHLRHIAGSVERLTAYLQGRQLTQDQIDAADGEGEPGASREALLDALGATLRNAEAVIRAIHPATLSARREVGRKRLPTTVAGLLTHIAEHTQRHVGQAISVAKLAPTLD